MKVNHLIITVQDKGKKVMISEMHCIAHSLCAHHEECVLAQPRRAEEAGQARVLALLGLLLAILLLGHVLFREDTVIIG